MNRLVGMTHDEHEHDTANAMARLFIENLAEELRTQDNAMTAWPIFLVQKRVMVTGLERDAAEELRWAGDDELLTMEEYATRLGIDWNEHTVEELLDLWDDQADIHDHALVGIAWRWEYESAHLTRRSAEEYIRANAHRHRHGLQVYVDSQRRVPEWRTLLTILERIEP